MAVTAQVYGRAAELLLEGSHDLDGATYNVMLCTSSYAPDIDTHDFRSDVTNEVTGTGYSAGGQALASVTVTYDSANNRAVFDAADVVWSSSTITARYAVVYRARGGASSADELLCYVDFGTDVSSTGGAFTIAWHANGIVTAAV
jgi:hypothetical protein